MNDKKLNKKEIHFLIGLIVAHKAGVDLLKGFRKPTQEEQDESVSYNILIKKLEALINC